ncbi:CheY-like two-component responsive regulatorfamily protein [Striga asiatica]|uniref:CheY-like two-component responsive regulatorfamily protein n=1 Tax=Striga asiatica TaxID=4170 RepID=A0A5A7PK33_STRAF|nr:CheY-like two-component responsive regulatorfamily protein [Striga asiatica]
MLLVAPVAEPVFSAPSIVHPGHCETPIWPPQLAVSTIAYDFHARPPLVVSSGETHGDDCTWRSEIFYHTTHRTGAANGSRSTRTGRRRSQPSSRAAQPPGRTVVAASQRRHWHNTGLVQTIEDAELVVPLVLSGTRRPPV